MTQITPKVFERLVDIKGYRPYIKSTLMSFGVKPVAKYELALKEIGYTTVMPMARARLLLAKAEGK